MFSMHDLPWTTTQYLLLDASNREALLFSLLHNPLLPGPWPVMWFMWGLLTFYSFLMAFVFFSLLCQDKSTTSGMLALKTHIFSELYFWKSIDCGWIIIWRLNILWHERKEICTYAYIRYVCVVCVYFFFLYTPYSRCCYALQDIILS